MTTTQRKRPIRPAKDAPADAPAGVSVPDESKDPTPTGSGPENRSERHVDPTPTLLTPELMAQFKAKGPHLTRFDLPNTGPGFYAMVETLDFTDPRVLNVMPKHLLSFALSMAMDMEGGTQPGSNPDGSPNPDKMIELLTGEAELSRTLCLIGFREPTLSPDGREGTLHVDDIHPIDRRRFMFHILRGPQQEAETLTRFPE